MSSSTGSQDRAPYVKICCIASVAEARAAVAAGASAVGLVSRMPSGPGVIPEARIAEIAAAIPPPTRTFLLTAETDAERIVLQHERTRTTTIQIVDAVAVDELRELRAALSGVELVGVVHVTGPEAVDEAFALGKHVDRLLLDSGDPRLVVKQLGGTGRAHDWALSREIVARAPVPVLLAGGLNAQNVGRALASVRPQGLDLCSGVRTDGALDEQKLRAFFAAVSVAGQS